MANNCVLSPISARTTNPIAANRASMQFSLFKKKRRLQY
jgi:hypothetical protein